MRDSTLRKDLLNSFRNIRGQLSVQDTTSERGRERVKNTTPKNSNRTEDKSIESFRKKLNNLENEIDTFTSKDLLYFFQYKAESIDYHYYISNFGRDLSVFKRLLKHFEPKEICLMIEFLFGSEQDYLQKTTIQPTILISNWVNTIYQDSLLWLSDDYVPKAKKSPKNKREWETTSNNIQTKIGVWEDD